MLLPVSRQTPTWSLPTRLRIASSSSARQSLWFSTASRTPCRATTGAARSSEWNAAVGELAERGRASRTSRTAGPRASPCGRRRAGPLGGADLGLEPVEVGLVAGQARRSPPGPSTRPRPARGGRRRRRRRGPRCRPGPRGPRAIGQYSRNRIGSANRSAGGRPRSPADADRERVDHQAERAARPSARRRPGAAERSGRHGPAQAASIARRVSRIGSPLPSRAFRSASQGAR